MAQKFYLYVADDGTQMGVPAEENVMALYSSIVFKTADDGDTSHASQPSAFDSLAALQAVVPAAIAKPATLNPRNLKLNVPGFGNASMPVLSNQPVDGANNASAYPGDFDTTIIEAGNLSSGANALPAEGSAEDDLTVLITGYQGEFRLS